MPPIETPKYDFKTLPAHCPVTGLPVHGHASWRYTRPGGRYRLRVSLLGDRIVWLQPMGDVRRDDARKGMALLEDVFCAALPGSAPFVVVDDYSAIRSVSLNARRLVFSRLRQERRVAAYIVYGAPRPLAAALAFARGLSLFPFEVVVATHYDAALAAAQRRLCRMETGARDGMDSRQILPSAGKGGARIPHGEEDATLAASAESLLRFLGAIVLEPYGPAPRLRSVSMEDPFRPVYDALRVMRDDRLAILARHHEARQKLEARERELTETQGLLNETHTALKILLANRQDERRRLERRVREGLHNLLQPLLGELTRARAGRAEELVALLQHIVTHVGATLPGETPPLAAPLTARERLIACLVSSGRDSRAIARLMALSPRTVENHCQRMRHKLGLRGRRPTLRERLTLRASSTPDRSAEAP